MKNHFHKKRALSALIVAMTFWIAIGPMAAEVVNAQGKEFVTIDANIPDQVKQVKEKIGTKILTAGVTIFYNA